MSDSINALIGAQHNASVIDSLANPPQVNVLGSISRAADAAKSVMGMRALKAQQAWGNALQQATDPTTGVPDYPRAQAIAAHDPDAAMGMAAGLESSSGRQTEQLNRAHMLLGMTYGAVSGLPANATRADVLAVLGRLKAAGTPGVDEEMAAVPQNDADVPAFVKQMNLAAGSAIDAYHARVGTPTTVNQNGAVVGTTQAPPDEGAGLRPPSGVAYPLGMTAEQWNAPVQGYRNPTNNQPEAITHGQLWERMGLVPKGYGMSPPVPTVVPVQPPAGPPAAVPGAKAAPAATPAPAPGTSTTVPTGPDPYMEAKWAASTKQYNDANEAAGNYQARIFPLVQAYSIIKSGTVTTGQTADAWNQIRGTLQTAATKMGWDAQSVAQANSEQLVKYTQQYINAQGLSARSDQALASAITGNPGSHISTLANEQVMPAMIGMERMRQMMLADFGTRPGDNSNPRNFSDFSTTWQNTHDPRAFIFDMLGTDERRKMIAGMKTTDERKRFNNTLNIVERNPGIMGQAALPH
jgi:hypothetical protein